MVAGRLIVVDGIAKRRCHPLISYRCYRSRRRNRTSVRSFLPVSGHLGHARHKALHVAMYEPYEPLKVVRRELRRLGLPSFERLIQGLYGVWRIPAAVTVRYSSGGDLRSLAPSAPRASHTRGRGTASRVDLRKITRVPDHHSLLIQPPLRREYGDRVTNSGYDSLRTVSMVIKSLYSLSRNRTNP